MNKVEAMCSGCANLNLENGGCKLAWITNQNQKERAEAKFCEDAEVLRADAEAQSAPAILIPESWARIFKKY